MLLHACSRHWGVPGFDSPLIRGKALQAESNARRTSQLISAKTIREAHAATPASRLQILKYKRSIVR